MINPRRLSQRSFQTTPDSGRGNLGYSGLLVGFLLIWQLGSRGIGGFMSNRLPKSQETGPTDLRRSFRPRAFRLPLFVMTSRGQPEAPQQARIAERNAPLRRRLVRESVVVGFLLIWQLVLVESEDSRPTDCQIRRKQGTSALEEYSCSSNTLWQS